MDQPIVIRDMHFTRCVLATGGGGGHVASPSLRSAVRSCVFEQCEHRTNFIGYIVVDDVVVDDLRGGTPAWVEGAVFRHCVLRGPISNLMIFRDPSEAAPEYVRTAFALANREFYAAVDWALDVTDAVGNGLVAFDMEPSLVRIDPDRQGFILASAVDGREAEVLSIVENTAFEHWFNVMRSKRSQNVLLVSGADDEDGDAERGALEELRRRGLVLPP